MECSNVRDGHAFSGRRANIPRSGIEASARAVSRGRTPQAICPVSVLAALLLCCVACQAVPAPAQTPENRFTPTAAAPLPEDGRETGVDREGEQARLASYIHPSNCRCRGCAPAQECGPAPCAPVPCGPSGPPPCVPAQPPAPSPEREVHHVYVEAPERGPQPARAAQKIPAGAFVAPPPQGAVVQERGSVGLRGMRITFPSWKIELPTIELPSVVRRQRGPRMELQEATAAYVAGAGQAAVGVTPHMTVPMTGLGALQVSRPATAPEQPASPEREEAEKKMAELEGRCRMLEEALRRYVPQRDLCEPPRPCAPTP